MDDLYQDVTGYNIFDTIEIDVKVHNATEMSNCKRVLVLRMVSKKKSSIYRMVTHDGDIYQNGSIKQYF
jgi:hypothetical protein